tara:strand:+ start:247 stop:714 length:468 start_codon:yes stop_codon:yes gene_type:complete
MIVELSREDIKKALIKTFSVVFHEKDNQELSKLLEISKVVEFSRDSQIISKNKAASKFYIILSGEVDIQIPIKNTDKLNLYTAKENEIVGWSSILEPGIYTADAFTKTNVTLLEFNTDQLLLEMRRFPNLGYSIMSAISQFLSHRLIKSLTELSK